MDLIHFQGLNCYFNCMITVAALNGIKYEDALVTLWSETDFAYNPNIHICITKKLVQNLEALGQKLNILKCTFPEVAAESLSLTSQGSFLVVGFDAFHIPWSPVYQLLHDPHYFIARKDSQDTFCCFDPTYNQQGMQITSHEISLHGFDICCLEKTAKTPLCTELRQEAYAVQRSHPIMKAQLIWNIRSCTQEKQKEAEYWAKYTDALINNRYLVKFYLQHVRSDDNHALQFFDGKFFMQWHAIKNGLYKASLDRNNEHICEEVCRLLEGSLTEELKLAKRIAG